MNIAAIIKKISVAILIVAVAVFIIYQKNKPVPITVTWQTLSEVIFKKTWYAPYNTNVNVPNFTDTLKKLHGQLVEITGFYIPMAMNSDKCALSKNPNSSCFFCGGGAIETIMMINFRGKMMDFPDDEVITVRGKFQLDTAFNK